MDILKFNHEDKLLILQMLARAHDEVGGQLNGITNGLGIEKSKSLLELFDTKKSYTKEDKIIYIKNMFDDLLNDLLDDNVSIDDLKNEILSNLEEDASEEDLESLCKTISNKYDIFCDYYHVGSYDSPGYDAEYYAIVFVDKEGDVGLVSHMIESY